ncbi:MAG TPA: glycosyltransferase [Bryobacteraceae bacterium]|jgi:GT2 family glycosyltransferase
MPKRIPETLPPEPNPPEEAPSGPRVSAVLLTFNQAPEARRAIEALERSTPRERLEIIVVDCGSGDEGPELDTHYPGIHLMRMPHHFGAAKAMNIAVRTAKADLVFFLSPYVEVDAGTVASLAAHLEEDSSAAAVCPLLVDEEGKPAPQVYADPTGGALAPVAADASTLSYPNREAIMVRKAFLRNMNYFDEHFGEYGVDLDLALQIRRAAKKIRVYPEIRVTRHPGTDPIESEPLAEADRIAGVSALLGKYQGFFTGFKYRLAAILKALLRFDLKLMALLLQGQKLDGSQAG